MNSNNHDNKNLFQNNSEGSPFGSQEPQGNNPFSTGSDLSFEIPSYDTQAPTSDKLSKGPIIGIAVAALVVLLAAAFLLTTLLGRSSKDGKEPANNVQVAEENSGVVDLDIDYSDPAIKNSMFMYNRLLSKKALTYNKPSGGKADCDMAECKFKLANLDDDESPELVIRIPDPEGVASIVYTYKEGAWSRVEESEFDKESVLDENSGFFDNTEEERKKVLGVNSDAWSVSASSELSINNNTYPAKNLMDGNKATAWAEGVEKAAGEWVEMKFEEMTLNALYIYNGYQKDDLFDKNGRVKAASVQFSDGSNYGFELKDNGKSYQLIKLPKDVTASSLKLTIDSTYEGAWTATCISEIALAKVGDGFKPAADADVIEAVEKAPSEASETSDAKTEEAASASEETSDENKDAENTSKEDGVKAEDIESWSMEEKNAYKSATGYLDIMAFSKQGLIDQLSSEYGDKYPVEVAEKVVNYIEENGEVDWFKEAEEAAESYLKYMSFSKQELIDQLSSEYGSKFTIEEAEQAVENVYK